MSCREIEDIKIYGIARIAKEVIEVADHLSEAIALCEHHKSAQTMAELPKLQRMYQTLSDLLFKYEIVKVNPTHQPFDPNEHHAISLK
jgi:molecular chaperone GrpE (heat shock protein)